MINDAVIRKFNKLFNEACNFYNVQELLGKNYYRMNNEDYINYLIICDKEGYTNRLVEHHNKALDENGLRLMKPLQQFAVLVIGGQYKLITPDIYYGINRVIRMIRAKY